MSGKSNISWVSIANEWYCFCNQNIKFSFWCSFYYIDIRGWTNCVDWQIISDEQIFWCANGTNKYFDEQIVWYLCVWKDDFFQDDLPIETNKSTLYDINSNQMVKCQTICSSSSVKTANDDSIFDDFPKISDHFLKILQNLSKAHMNVDKHFPKISEDYRRLPKTFEIEANVFRWYTNEFKYNLRSTNFISVKSSNEYLLSVSYKFFYWSIFL